MHRIQRPHYRRRCHLRCDCFLTLLYLLFRLRLIVSCCTSLQRVKTEEELDGRGMWHEWGQERGGVVVKSEGQRPLCRHTSTQEDYTEMDLTFMGPCIVGIFLLIYFQQDSTLHSLFIYGKLLYMFRVVSPPIIRSSYNYIYSIGYLSNRYCYLPLLWKSWNWFECGVGIVLICFGAVATAPKQINTIPTPRSNQLQLFHKAAGSSNGLTSTRYCKYSLYAPDDGWRYHPKHVEQFSRNK